MAETKYTKDHEWVRLDGGIATVGITDHAQTALRELLARPLPGFDALIDELQRAGGVTRAADIVEAAVVSHGWFMQ